MAMSYKGKYFSMKINGGEELMRALRAMPEDLRKKAVIAGMKRGAKIVLDTVLQNAPKGATGNLSKRSNWKIRGVRLKPHHKMLHVMIKPVYGPKGNPHFHLIEHGVRPHFIPRPFTFGEKEEKKAKLLVTKGGQILGRKVLHPGSPANPFYRRSFEQTKEKAIESILERIRSYMNRELWRKAK